MAEYKFQGWLGYDTKSVHGNMKWDTFEPKKWTENDVDIRITHCGICGSDIHTLSSGWRAATYPCCVGHEIVGHAVRVGANVENIKVGDRVGVGPQAHSCLRPGCPECSSGQENYCPARVSTYNANYPGDEGRSFGGYGDYQRTDHRFVVPIPDSLASEHAAPMLCAGTSVFAPLRAKGCGPGRSVGIIGVGGLGHMGIMQEREAMAMGADAYIATADDKGWAVENVRSLDLLVNTVSSEDMPLSGYLALLKTGGELVQLGAPDGSYLPPINVFSLLASGIKVSGSFIGSPADMRAMLELVVEKGVRPWVQTRPMDDANQAVRDMAAGKARYRYVLVNEKHIDAGR